MFKFLRRDPLRALEKQYAQKLEEARDAQRSGKIPLFAERTAEADAIAQKLDALRAEQQSDA